MMSRAIVLVVVFGGLGVTACSSRLKTQAPAQSQPAQTTPVAPVAPAAATTPGPGGEPSPAPSAAPSPSPASKGYVACEHPRPEICTQEYRPVCASVEHKINCITAPCPQPGPREYPNGCAACTDPDVFGYVPGTCGGKIHGTGVDPAELPLQ
ncbi:MAG: hypothetical protein ABUS79_29235 [Pseudomonadota bacterium]